MEWNEMRRKGRDWGRSESGVEQAAYVCCTLAVDTYDAAKYRMCVVPRS